MLSVILTRELSFHERVQQMLRLGCERFGLPVGILARIRGQAYEVQRLHLVRPMLLEAGDTFHLTATACAPAARTNQAVCFHDAPADSRISHPGYADCPPRAYLGAPVRVNGGVWGTLNFSSPDPRPEPFTDAQLHEAQMLAEWIGLQLAQEDLVKRLRRSEGELRAMHAACPLGMFMTDVEGNCIRINQQYTQITGVNSDDALGDGWMRAVHEEDRPRVEAQWRKAALAGRLYESKHRFRQYDGGVVWTHTLAAQIYEDGKLSGYVGTVEDITARHEAQRKLEYAAMHDGLTGLPNRRQLHDRIAAAIERKQRDPDYQFALLFLDFDGFKQVNDTFGHERGDRLLVHIAERIRRTLREHDAAATPPCGHLPARIGGDEMVILLENLTDPNDAMRVADRVHEVTSQPFDVRGQLIQITASIGAAFGAAELSVDHLIRRADAAMYQAKREGKARTAAYAGDPAPVTSAA